MPDYLVIISSLTLINALTITLAYYLGSTRSTPFNVRSAFRTLIEKRTSVTSPTARANTKRAINALSQ